MAFRDGDRPRLQYYNFQNDAGEEAWYNRQGQSAQKTYMRTPVNGARITSPFMKQRMNPILGYSRPHKGVDFGCPIGTPIMAARDGVVAAKAFEAMGYGNFIYLNHGGGQSTRYGHMSAYNEPISVGMAVKQGQVIGFVGQTGDATGPHLHFEIRQDGEAVDPMSVTSDALSVLGGAELTRFEREADLVDHWRREAPSAAR